MAHNAFTFVGQTVHRLSHAVRNLRRRLLSFRTGAVRVLACRTLILPHLNHDFGEGLMVMIMDVTAALVEGLSVQAVSVVPVPFSVHPLKSTAGPPAGIDSFIRYLFSDEFLDAVRA